MPSSLYFFALPFCFYQSSILEYAIFWVIHFALNTVVYSTHNIFLDIPIEFSSNFPIAKLYDHHVDLYKMTLKIFLTELKINFSLKNIFYSCFPWRLVFKLYLWWISHRLVVFINVAIILCTFKYFFLILKRLIFHNQFWKLITHINLEWAFYES